MGADLHDDPPVPAVEPTVPLPFGIPMLDELLGYNGLECDPPANRAEGIGACLGSPTTLALVGQDGTGKSIYALHLAAMYQCVFEWHNHLGGGEPAQGDAEAAERPVVLYLSSDFDYTLAGKAWRDFGLSEPWLRYVPFVPPGEKKFRRRQHDTVLKQKKEAGQEDAASFRIDLIHCVPKDTAARDEDADANASGDQGRSVVEFLRSVRESGRGSSRLPAQVGFIDLNRHTAGDDWLFAVRLVSSLARGGGKQPPNLLILDSVEGFETLVGEQNTFGERMSRRARISQLMRAAKGSWHVVFLVEEPEPGKRHPEEYVTDTVIHLRRQHRSGRAVRTIEIEKCRGRSFGSGEHPFEIRSGKGSSTGEWENPDDPYVRRHPEVDKGPGERHTSYVQVFPSLDYLSKRFARNVARRDPASEEAQAESVAAFGIKYLDEMLGEAKAGAGVKRPANADAPHSHGLPSGSITSLIGDGGTRKEALAEQFLLHSFDDFPQIFAFAVACAKLWQDQPPDARGKKGDLSKHLVAPGFQERCFAFLEGSPLPNDDPTAVKLGDPVRAKLRKRFVGDWLLHFNKRREDLDGIATSKLILADPSRRGTVDQPYMARWNEREFYDEDDASDAHGADMHCLVIALSLLRMAGSILTPIVLVTTQDASAGQLSDRLFEVHRPALESVIRNLLRTIHDKAQAGTPYDAKSSWSMQRVLRWHFRKVLEQFLVVRRIDNAEITAPQLWHIVERSVDHGLDLFGRKESETQRIKPISGVGDVRVVVSDLRLIHDVFPDVADDPLFLPVLVFRLRRLGVTALIVDTDHGRPDMPAQPRSLALRSLVNYQILTWKVPFFGEERIAIAVSPPMNKTTVGVIRELRVVESVRSDGRAAQPWRLDVDPHFELYAGVEQGKPQAVPLQVSLWAETPAFVEYAKQEDELLSRLFVKAANAHSIIEALNTRAYGALRDYTHLPNDTKLPHTHVFAVDGYWALSQSVAALRKQTDYLFRPLAEGPEAENRRIDAFRLYSGNARRADGFEQRKNEPTAAGAAGGPSYPFYYRSRIRDGSDIDRVPFTWDFGFLLCDREQWRRAEKLGLKLNAPSARGLHGAQQRAEEHKHVVTVGNVWRSLHRLETDDDLDDAEEAAAGCTTLRDDGLSEGSHHDAVKRLPKAPRERRLHVQWRAFLGACRLVADEESSLQRRPILAFDLTTASSASLVSFLFEVWLSEVVKDIVTYQGFIDRLKRSVDTSAMKDFAQDWISTATDDVRHLSMEFYEDSTAAGGKSESNRFLRFFIGDGSSTLQERFRKAQDLSDPLKNPVPTRAKNKDEWRALRLQQAIGDGYSLQLYKAWLLLIEVLEFRRYHRTTAPVELVNDYLPDTGSVAVRYWYKNACAYLQGDERTDHEHEGRLGKVPVRLPGHFSMRGDWFLAVAKGSRSSRLADLALDILTSRRANRTRLEAGLGLPTRDLVHGPALASVRTGLPLHTLRGKIYLSYGKLLHLGGSFASLAQPDQGRPQPGDASPAMEQDSFFWLFRSGFEQYYRYAPVFRNWVTRLVSWTDALRTGDVGIAGRSQGFDTYDALEAGGLEGLAAQENFIDFAVRLDKLCDELESECSRPPA